MDSFGLRRFQPNNCSLVTQGVPTRRPLYPLPTFLDTTIFASIKTGVLPCHLGDPTFFFRRLESLCRDNNRWYRLHNGRDEPEAEVVAAVVVEKLPTEVELVEPEAEVRVTAD